MKLYCASLTTANKNDMGEEQMHLLDKKFHSAVVNRISICVRKPLLTTVSSDKSIRVWNIETGEMEIYKEFNEEAFGVAFHPSGTFSDATTHLLKDAPCLHPTLVITFSNGLSNYVFTIENTLFCSLSTK